ncbi:MAG TPA: hypothetical protein VHB20_13850 [Verrucomicrobiae bacterium]|jgi:hypothetical protein|nr:hypothetical protein [Verrucomicrobiae bacterium]
MRRFGLILFCLALCLAPWTHADTYTLTDGSSVSGEPVSPYKDDGIVFKQGDTAFSDRITWDKFTQASIVKLRDAAKTASDREMVEPLVETSAEAAAKRKEINVKPVELPPRPAHPPGILGLFGSPVGWFLFLTLYAANIFAAYEVSVYRKHPPGLVCGLAAIPLAGVLSTIYFLFVPPKVVLDDGLEHVTSDMQTTAIQSDLPVGSVRRTVGEKTPLPAQAMPTVPPVPALPGNAPDPEAAAPLPAPIVYMRGEYSFNRRFFETKLTGFFRLVPSAEIKDLRILIRSSRGEFRGRRITRITPTELYLQVGEEGATADEMIPFTEVLELQVRHKDLA